MAVPLVDSQDRHSLVGWGMREDECGSNPQGLSRPWGFFLSTRRRHPICWAVAMFFVAVAVGIGSDVSLAQADEVEMARRQQGILTGMPFMANVTPRTFVD